MITFCVRAFGFIWMLAALGVGSWWCLAGLLLLISTVSLDGEVV
jgi:hypothetical protein